MSDYIDLAGLLRVALWSLGASAILALVYSVGVVGLSRTRVAGAGAGVVPRVVSVAAFAVFLGAIALGIYVMSQK